MDRSKDMISSSGENIYSAEVEQVFYAHPAVVEVMVIGVPHPRWVEMPIGVVVTRDTVDARQLVDHCRSWLTHFKASRQVFFVDCLPRNAMGKVQKFRLREEFAENSPLTRREEGYEHPSPTFSFCSHDARGGYDLQRLQPQRMRLQLHGVDERGRECGLVASGKPAAAA
jgi:hypothetical protein